MAGERRINFGADATDARYRTEDTGDGANFVVAEDLDGGTVLLEYDDSRTPSEWVVRGPVDLDGNDLSAGAIDATEVTTEQADITGMTYIEADRGSANTGVSAGSWGKVVDQAQVDNLNELNSNGQFEPSETGRYNIEGLCVISSGGTADAVAVRVYNVTDSDIVRDSTRLTNIDVSNGFIRIPLTLTAELYSGKTYEVQVVDETSSYNIDGGEVTITRQVVHE